MTAKIFAIENAIVERLRSAGFLFVKQVYSSPDPAAALSGAPVGTPVIVVAPTRASVVDSTSDSVLLDREIAVVVLFKGSQAGGSTDETVVDSIARELHGFCASWDYMTPLALRELTCDYEDGFREYTLFLESKLRRVFSQ